MHHLTLPSFSIDIVTGAHLRAAELHAVGRGMMFVVVVRGQDDAEDLDMLCALV